MMLVMRVLRPSQIGRSRTPGAADTHDACHSAVVDPAYSKAVADDARDACFGVVVDLLKQPALCP